MIVHHDHMIFIYILINIFYNIFYNFLCLGRRAYSASPCCDIRNLSLETDFTETCEIPVRLLAWCP